MVCTGALHASQAAKITALTLFILQLLYNWVFGRMEENRMSAEPNEVVA
jgi:hypothetical protein